MERSGGLFYLRLSHSAVPFVLPLYESDCPSFSAERSMLRSMLRPADDGEKKAVGGGERLRKHEYEDDSEEEDRARPELRARSASYGSVFRNRRYIVAILTDGAPSRETPPLRFVREKTGTHVVDQRESVGPQRKLLFDSEFGCFYDPVADRYFSVGHS